MQITKLGDGLALPIPSDVIEALDLKEGDDVEVTIAGDRSLELSRRIETSELLTRLRVFRGRLPVDFVFDRDEANAR